MKLGQTDINIGQVAFGCWRFAKHDVSTADRIRESGYAAQVNLTGRETYDIIEAYRRQNMP